MNKVTRSNPKGVLGSNPKGVLGSNPKGVLGSNPKGVLEGNPKGVLESNPKGILKSGPQGIISLPVDVKAKVGPKLYLIAGSVIPVTLRKSGRYVLADVGDKTNVGYTMCLLDGGWQWVNNSNIEGMSSKRGRGGKKRNVSSKA